MLPSRCSQPPCRNWLVTSVAVSRRQVVAAAPGRGQVGRDDAPRRDELRRARRSPPLAMSPSSQANTTKQAMTSASVTTGVRRVGLASRSGITGPLRSGLLGRLRGLAFAGLALGWPGSDAGLARARPMRRRGVRHGDRGSPGMTPSLDIQTRVAGWPRRRPGRRTSPRRSDQSGAAAGEAVLRRWYVPSALSQRDDPPVRRSKP